VPGVDDFLRDPGGLVDGDREADTDGPALAAGGGGLRRFAAFTAITLPVRSTSGPPEFPGLIAASVWIASITVSWL